METSSAQTVTQMQNVHKIIAETKPNLQNKIFCAPCEVSCISSLSQDSPGPLHFRSNIKSVNAPCHTVRAAKAC